MPITLAQGSTVERFQTYQPFIIDEFRKSALLDMLPFDNCVKPQGGKTLAYVYNRVTTLPTAALAQSTPSITAQEAATTAYTTHLKVFGGSFPRLTA